MDLEYWLDTECITLEQNSLPGALERRTREQRLKQGIPIDDEGWKNMKRAAGSVGIDIEEESL